MTPEKEIEILKWLVENYHNYGTSYAGVWELIKIVNHYHESEVKKLNEPAVSKSEGIERETSCKHSDWIDLYYSSGDIYGRYCIDCGEFFE